MTNIAALIRRAQDAGIELRRTRRGIDLVVTGRGVNPELMAELRSRRAELLTELDAHRRPDAADKPIKSTDIGHAS